MPSNEQRPEIESITTATEFDRWYWLKDELIKYCRTHELGTTGQKRELATRIACFLCTGEIVKPKRKKSTSSFDWGKSELSVNTVITDNYRNSQNMRKFMKANAGDHFSFSNEFMEWMRKNTGKTLSEALVFWTALDKKKRKSGYREKPLPQNQYNQFTRALSHAKPGISAQEIRRLWAIKRSKPGPHIFQSGDEDN